MRERVAVANPSDGGLAYWLFKLYAFAALVVVMLVAFGAGGLYVHFARQIPPLPDLSTYAYTAPGVTSLVALDGTLIAELSTERREIVPLGRVPQPLVDAFVSTEDRRFFSHGGFDLRGTVRALLANLRAGQVTQGGSTITQQVAKAFLSSERSYSRKLKELILARRLEARYSKREILALYLNHIFLGNGAYGVEAAARRYFDRDVWDLDVGQLALVAGLARAPSRYNPFVDEPSALERRNTVLDNMVETGVLTKARAAEAKRAPLGLSPRRDYFHEVTPYFAEHVRRELIKRLGQKALYEGGYRVETTVLPWADVVAQENVDAAARRLDKRQGFRGPEARLDERGAEELRRRARALYGTGPLVEGKLYLGLVESVHEEGATVRVGGRTYPMPLANLAWAAPWSQHDAINDRVIEKASEALKKRDVVWVSWAFRSRIPRFSEFAYDDEGNAQWVPEQTFKRPRTVELQLEQTPKVEGALYSFDHQNGYVLAMAGGDDFDRSEFNRVTQACRLPGSAYKPIYYSLALDRGYDYATLWNDKPKIEIDPETGQKWVPLNVDGTYGVQASLERALVWSKNPPSEQIFQILGTKDVGRWHTRLGFTTPLVSNAKCEREFCPALALGSSCVHIDEITRAFAVFARNGRPITPQVIRRVIDRQGRVLEDHTTYDDPWLARGDALDRVAQTAGVTVEPVIAPRTAYLTTKLLREVVTQGHSEPIRATKIIAAVKTGTSSRTSDVWCIGFTSRLMTTAWLGNDRYKGERELGKTDQSFMLTVPMWARFMYGVAGGMPLEEIPWERPAGVKSHDIGGPLKDGLPPPPPPGFGVDGKPIELPANLRDPSLRVGAPPVTTVRPRTVRVQGAPQHGLKPGEEPVTPSPTPTSALPKPKHP